MHGAERYDTERFSLTCSDFATDPTASGFKQEIPMTSTNYLTSSHKPKQNNAVRTRIFNFVTEIH